MSKKQKLGRIFSFIALFLLVFVGLGITSLVNVNADSTELEDEYIVSNYYVNTYTNCRFGYYTKSQSYKLDFYVIDENSGEKVYYKMMYIDVIDDDYALYYCKDNEFNIDSSQLIATSWFSDWYSAPSFYVEKAQKIELANFKSFLTSNFNVVLSKYYDIKGSYVFNTDSLLYCDRTYAEKVESDEYVLKFKLLGYLYNSVELEIDGVKYIASSFNEIWIYINSGDVVTSLKLNFYIPELNTYYSENILISNPLNPNKNKVKDGFERVIFDRQAISENTNDFLVRNGKFGYVDDGKDYTIKDLFFSVVDIPIHYLQKLLDISIFGTTIFAIICSILTIGLVVYIFKGGKK